MSEMVCDEGPAPPVQTNVAASKSKPVRIGKLMVLFRDAMRELNQKNGVHIKILMKYLSDKMNTTQSTLLPKLKEASRRAEAMGMISTVDNAKYVLKNENIELCGVCGGSKQPDSCGPKKRRKKSSCRRKKSQSRRRKSRCRRKKSRSRRKSRCERKKSQSRRRKSRCGRKKSRSRRSRSRRARKACRSARRRSRCGGKKKSEKRKRSTCRRKAC